jgi:CDP-diglyceride synthetase
MERTFQLKLFLSSLAMNVPTLLVCFVAGVVILGRWREGSSASFYAVLGFGLVLVLCFAMPLAQTMIQQWVFYNGQSQSRMWAFTVFGVVGSVLHALIYALLLAAIYAGRPKVDMQNLRG